MDEQREYLDKSTKRFLMASLTLALALVEICPAQEIVATQAGKVKGVSSEGITSFKGIPYASPPVGPLRWRPPQPAKPWDGVLVADHFGPSCPQPFVKGENTGPNPKFSEDCLYLNLWRPEKTNRKAKLPVMVWIHGGGFLFGAGSSPLYDGASLARTGVILVNFNYRLGRFGWFAYPELTREGEQTGNYGLMDDVAALKWVQQNIGAFGGDPDNVTIFGESAGAMSINALMCSPACRGLFAKAITESGFGRTKARSLANAEKLGTDFAQSVGAIDLAALRRLPAEKILGRAGVNLIDPNGPGLILDGKIVEKDVARAFTEGTEAAVPWIVGSNNFESSLFHDRLAHPEEYLNTFPKDLRDQLEDLYNADGRYLASLITTDVAFTEPARFLSSQHEKSGSPAYRYYFLDVPERARGVLPGAPHTGELEFVFGNFGANQYLNLEYTEADRTISAAVQTYWTNFAKTGNPNGPNLPDWPQDKDDRVLFIDTHGEHVVSNWKAPMLNLIEGLALKP